MNVRSISMYIYTYIDMFGKYIAVKGQAGDSWTQEANYFLPETVVPWGGKRSLRRYHMVVVDSDEYVGRFIHPRAGRV